MTNGIQHKKTHRSEASALLHHAEKDVHPVQAFFTKFSNDWAMSFAGALAYSLLTAMLPIAIAIVSVLGFILGNNPQQLLQQLTTVLPGVNPHDPAIQQATRQLQDSAGFLAIIAVLLAIFGGSRLFLGLEGFLDIVYRVRPRKMINQNIMAIGMIILFILLTPIMLFASSLPGIILTFLATNPAMRHIPLLDLIARNPVVTTLAGIAGGLIAAFILFEAIYIIVPNQRISWGKSWLGAVIAAVALQLFLTLIFPFYVGHFMKNYVGQIGFAVVLLVFFYYFAVILMLGAEINAFFSAGVGPLPNDLATFVSTMAGRLQHDIPDEEAHSHVNQQPTELEDKTHIADAHRHAKDIEQENQQKQQKIVSHDQAKASKKAAKSRTALGKTTTLVSVLAGSALAMGIELLRQRQQAK